MRSFRIALLIAFAGLAAPASAQSFLGRWTATATVPDGSISEEIVAVETADGYSITGKVITEQPPGSPEGSPGYDIVLEGDRFSYKRSVAGPEGEIVITYTGTVNGDTFTGTAELLGFSVPYNGVRSSRPG